MKNGRQTKNELIAELESSRKKVKKLETLLKKRKHTEPDIIERKRAKAGMAVAQQLYRELFENVNVGILRTTPGPEGTFVDVNPAMVRMFEADSREQLMALHPSEIYWDASQRKIISDAIVTKDFAKEEIRFKTLKGRPIWCRITAVKKIDTNGQISFDNTIEDITERKRAEEELKKAEGKFRAIFDNASDGMFLVDLNAQKFFTCNAMCVKMLGYTQEEFLTLDIDDIHPPEDLPFINEQIGKFSKGEEGIRSDIRFKRKDDSIFAADLRTAILTIAEKKYLLINFNDITERKKANEELKKSKMLLESVINSSEDLILVVDRDLRIQMSNWKSPLYAGRTEFPIGSHCYEAFIHRDTPCEPCHVFGVFNTGRPICVEYYNQYTKLFKEVNAYPIFDDNNNVTMVVEDVRDITERKRVEDKLRTSEVMYRRLFEAARDGILILDADTGMVVDVNPFLIEMLSYSREQFLGKRIWELGFIKDDAINKLNFKELQRKKFIHYENMPLETANGRLINVEFVSYVYQVDHHNVIQCNIRDITERIRVEETVKSAKAFLDTVVDMSPFAMWISDNKGTLIRANHSLCDTINLTDDKIIGKYNVLKDVNLDIQGVMPMVRAVFEKHDPARFSIPWKAADAGDVDSKGGRDMYIDVSMYPILNAQSELTNVVCQWLDITERKRAEEALRENEALLQTVINILPVGLWVFDAEGKIVISSAAAQRIWAGVRYIGIDQLGEYKGWRTDSGKLIEAHEWAGARALEKGETSIEEEVEIECFDGTHKIILDSGVPLRKSDGSISGAVTINHDITVRKKAEEEILKLNAELEQRVAQRTSQLESANKELEAFSYSVSHDLRAPLRHIGGYVELLGEQYQKELPEKGRHYLEEIIDSTHQMGVLIDDLLKFSKSGRVEMHESTVDMNRIVEEVSEQMRQDNPQRDIEWSIDQLPSVHCDKAMLHLVWENLLSNAVKFTNTRKKARIKVGVREENKEFIFYVHDNGVGFDMQYAQKLFGVFQRLHSSAEFEGTGVGLANVHHIIARHSGRTWAEAELDKGATFYFSIPK
jgi:PAS domain S-box-containing protein